MIPGGIYTPLTYGASKPPLRVRLAAQVERASNAIWAWGTLSQDRRMTEVDLALINFCAALDRLADAIRQVGR